MAARRRYTKAEKVAVVAEAERTSLTQAAEATGIPITTIKYWFDGDQFADVRTKTRDQLAEGSVAMALIAQGELVKRILNGAISDQALVAAFGVGIDKAQLLAGNATSRTETRDITGTLSDAELDAAIEEAQALVRRVLESEVDGTPEEAAGE